MSILYKTHLFIKSVLKYCLYRKIKALTLELFLKITVIINKLFYLTTPV
jgi:hypothetical protein